MPNRLSKETSPYLLQHAGNPVDWFPWGPEALAKAKQENKLIIVSIGYSACHWCHVMEHESFEDEEVAAIMNKYFVSVKVDREERPDIDQIYMLAVQLMTGQGGWPLNCICLPDQRPIYGGTYFRKHDWTNLLLNLAAMWEQKPQEAIDYAERLTAGIGQVEKLNLSDNEVEYSKQDITDVFLNWQGYFDLKEGGHNRAPKFPMPNNWQFMLRYAHFFKDKLAGEITFLTLDKMACGGIYDQIGGGFARYSVDDRWHVPHFEKMLYDNGQLLSLYSEAYQVSKKELYKNVVYQTVDWLRREMVSPDGGFYSALDADSEGVEGKYYTFEKKELEKLLGEDAELFCSYYGVTEEGNWPEESTNVLMRTTPDEDLARQLGIRPEELKERISDCRGKVFSYREQRVKPGLDNKIIASWNGIMLKGLTDAYKTFSDAAFLELAVANGEFISKHLVSEKGRLQRMFRPEGKAKDRIETAFLDDYAFVIDGFIGLYEVTFNEMWINRARTLADYVLQQFYDAGTGMLYYTSLSDEELIARKHEILDNVIPSSNSAMAVNLFRLGHFFDYEPYLEQSKQMLDNVFPHIKTYGSGYSNWAILLMLNVFGAYEIAITGAEAETKRRELDKTFIPNKVIMGGVNGTLPLLQDKAVGETTIFVCKNRTCQLPVTAVSDALAQMQ